MVRSGIRWPQGMSPPLLSSVNEPVKNIKHARKSWCTAWLTKHQIPIEWKTEPSSGKALIIGLVRT